MTVVQDFFYTSLVEDFQAAIKSTTPKRTEAIIKWNLLVLQYIFLVDFVYEQM